MPEQATVEPADLDQLVALLREQGKPLPMETLVERYVALLTERLEAQIEAMPPEATTPG